MGVFWVIDGLTAASEDTTVPFSYVCYASLYAGLLTVAVLSIAIAVFQRREVG